MSDNFIPTGLLSSISSATDFVSNGLLDDSSTLTSHSATVSASLSSTHTDSRIPSDHTLAQPSPTIACLGENCASTPSPRSTVSSSSAVQHTTLELTDPASQDDTFLPISDILGLKKTSHNPTFSTGTSHPRAPLRATTFDGKSLLISRKSRIHSTGVRKPLTRPPMANLLDVPIHRLMDELSVLASSKPITPTSKQNASQPLEDTLWVDQYRPRRFTELLGNERVARDVMTWVKQWDWCVFGKRRNKKRPREDDEACDPEDEYHRPREKLLLISGPPGLGKTTLAHVIAVHAGYEVMEINASDTRSAQAIDDRIRPILESGSTVRSTKPVLLIIDEIDGATGGGGDNSSGFIQKLVSLTLEKPRKKRKVGAQKDKRPLLRPIICICNDQNAPSLAKLRPHARQIRFTRPADIHIIRRLRHICDLEGLNTDTRALNTLVSVAKGDLRGCLNTLQFIKSRNESVTEDLIRRATVGMKEADVTATVVLNEIFASLSRKRARELAIGEEEEARYVNRLSRTIEGLNNNSGIANGCFAHYTYCHCHEPTMHQHEKAIEWLGIFDVFSSVMYIDGDFGLQAYLPYFLVPFHPLCRERSGQRVERDSTDWDNLLVTRTNEEILKSLVDGIRTSGRNTGANRHLITGQVLQLEFVPYINRIISPPLRPVNSQVIKAGERALLSRLVEIMICLELRFVQEKAEDGQLVYRLDPPVDVFVTYDRKRATDIAVSRYAVRHLVATEIDAALATRQAIAGEKITAAAKRNFFRLKPSPEESEEFPEGPGHTEEEGPLERAQAPGSLLDPVNKRARIQGPNDIVEKPPVDFFGRPITVPKAPNSSVSRTKHRGTQEFQTTYRFLEGNSAAVRKPVKVSSFL